MKRKWLICTLLALFLVALSGSALAWSGKADADGKPEQLKIGATTGYYIWQDKHGFHVWTTTNGESHVFSGVIRTNGKFLHVRGQRLEAGDSLDVQTSLQDNHWFRSSQGDRRRHFAFGGRDVNFETDDKIRFSFDTTGGSDGINLRIKDAKYIEFDLFIDGHPVSRREIHISESGWHPESHHFRLFE